MLYGWIMFYSYKNFFIQWLLIETLFLHFGYYEKQIKHLHVRDKTLNLLEEAKEKAPCHRSWQWFGNEFCCFVNVYYLLIWMRERGERMNDLLCAGSTQMAPKPALIQEKQETVWFAFLLLSDTVANNAYLFCEFSVTQVSNHFYGSWV